jgi:hypothetical protein
VPSTKPKAKKIGRPKLPKGEAKGRIVPVRFNAEEVKRIARAATAGDQNVSEWIRRAVMAIAIESQADHGYEQGALVYFSNANHEMVAIVREKEALRVALDENWSLQEFLNRGYVNTDVNVAYGAAKAIEAIIPKR